MLRQALATARLTRLITQDTVVEDVRDDIAKAHPMLDELVHCNWCAGVWAAGIVLALDRQGPTRRVVDMLAVAQAGFMVMSLTALVERTEQR